MKQQNKSISFEEALQDPAYEHLWGTLRYLETAKFSNLFPKKHLLALQDLIARKLKALHGEIPSLPLKDAVTHALENLPDDTSAAVVMELTRFAIE
ncbi:MAG: hypothetical protein ACKVUS_00150, partial [Saprospiraceae bacterium]